MVFEEQQQTDQFGKEFDEVCMDLGIGVNNRKKQLGCIVDFLGLEFDTLQMEARLPKHMLKNIIEGVAKILEKKSSTSHEELQSLVGLFLFAAKIICPSWIFLRRLYNALTKGGKYLHLSKSIKDDLLWWEKFLPWWNRVTLLRSQRQYYSLWTDTSGFYDTGEYFLSEHYTL